MFNRLSNSLRNRFRGWLGWQHDGWTGLDAEYLSPQVYQTQDARFRRYQINEGYYTNRIYNNRPLMARLQAERPKLYRYIRGIHNPIQRYVTIRSAKIYPGSVDLDTLSRGALPFAGLDTRQTDALRQVLKWSDISRNLRLFTKYGAKLGDTAWQVVDAPQWDMVWIEPLNPYKIVNYVADGTGELTEVEIAYQEVDDRDETKTYTRRMLITLDKFYTFKDDEPFAFPENADANGVALSEWDNEYGFIPIALAQDVATGGKWGETGFTHSLMKVDEINDQVSLLNDQIRKVINPRWASFGARVPGGRLESDSGRDDIDILEFPIGGSLQPFVSPLDIASTRANIDAEYAELEQDLPELSLHRLRDGGNVTAPGVRAAYSDASDRILEAQSNYDAATIKALQMALCIGGYRGYQGFQGFSLDMLWSDDLTFTLKERAIIEDALSKQERLQALQSIGSTRLILQELDFSQEEIDTELGREDEQARAAIRGMTEAAFGQQPEDEDEDDADTKAETDEEEA